jgi:hypothetical protein
MPAATDRWPTRTTPRTVLFRTLAAGCNALIAAAPSGCWPKRRHTCRRASLSPVEFVAPRGRWDPAGHFCFHPRRLRLRLTRYFVLRTQYSISVRLTPTPSLHLRTSNFPYAAMPPCDHPSSFTDVNPPLSSSPSVPSAPL